MPCTGSVRDAGSQSLAPARHEEIQAQELTRAPGSVCRPFARRATGFEKEAGACLDQLVLRMGPSDSPSFAGNAGRRAANADTGAAISASGSTTLALSPNLVVRRRSKRSNNMRVRVSSPTGSRKAFLLLPPEAISEYPSTPPASALPSTWCTSSQRLSSTTWQRRLAAQVCFQEFKRLSVFKWCSVHKLSVRIAARTVPAWSQYGGDGGGRARQTQRFSLLL